MLREVQVCSRVPRTLALAAYSRDRLPSAAEVRDELRDTLSDLLRCLRPTDEVSRDALHTVASQVKSWTPAGSVTDKYGIRQSLWALRQACEAGGGRPPASAREAYERLRAVCLDNTWEASLRRLPGERYVVRPRMRAVPNFHYATLHDGDMISRVLRGGEPTQEGVDWLLTQGKVGVVIDLTEHKTDASWMPASWRNARVYHIPVIDYTAPTCAQLKRIIHVLDHPPQGQNVYIHCKAGVGRTGVAIACWRVTHGWSADDAIAAEALDSYDASLKQAQAVRDFERRWKAEQAAHKLTSV